ncbi:MAG: M23 family metallopeptidase [Clostridia bacterium]|jgi:murein DD-endopeptidase MepM/ murein hydrolase activator NlpD|nr:M23 family metallopeptidase [Clostridia bacterium]
MNNPFKADYGCKPGLFTRAKRRLSMIFSKIGYRLKYSMPRLPRLYLPVKLKLRLIQTGVSVLLLFVIMGIFQLEYNWAKSLQQEIRSTFSQQRDYSAMVKDYLTFGWWLNSYDRMVFTNRGDEESIPVVADNKPRLSPPVSGRVVKRFGMVRSELDGKEYFHEGINIEAPLGTPVVAVLDGRVVRVNESSSLGRVVQIDHGNGVYSLYAYCGEILVKEGQEVAKNQVIAKVGQTGNAVGPMLHFELREQGQLVDPLTRISAKSSGI